MSWINPCVLLSRWLGWDPIFVLPETDAKNNGSASVIADSQTATHGRVRYSFS